jgi:hypothetical protein
MSRHGTGPPLRVTIVCSNEETLDGLEAYLRQAGIVVHATRALEEKLARECDAMVFFPDEFATDAALAVMVGAHRERPAMRVVVVTHQRDRFAAALGSEDVVATVIPKPAWGWTILDAIRGAPEP